MLIKELMPMIHLQPLLIESTYNFNHLKSLLLLCFFDRNKLVKLSGVKEVSFLPLLSELGTFWGFFLGSIFLKKSEISVLNIICSTEVCFNFNKEVNSS